MQCQARFLLPENGKCSFMKIKDLIGECCDLVGWVEQRQKTDVPCIGL